LTFLEGELSNARCKANMQNILRHTIAAVCFALGSLLAPAVLAQGPSSGCRPSGAPPQGLDLREPCPPTTEEERAPKPSTRVWRPVLRAVKRRPPAAPEPPAPDGPERWYGWQVVIADGLSIGLLGAGLAVASSTDGSDSGGASISNMLFSLALFGYLGGAPVLHAFHERPAMRVVGSLGLRVGLPLVGAGLGLAIANCGSSNDGSFGDFCELGAVSLGVMIGLATAMVTDAALSFEPIEPVTTGIALAPALRVEHGRAIGGVIGRF
jgi:hypothetical protein